MNPETSYHMSPEEFRKHGYAVIDWIVDYQKRVESLPVLSTVQPGDIRAALPAHPPQQDGQVDGLDLGIGMGRVLFHSAPHCVLRAECCP